MNILAVFTLFSFYVASSSSASKTSLTGRGRLAMLFLQRYQKKEDPDAPQSRNARGRGSKHSIIIAREDAIRQAANKPPTTAKSTLQLEKEKKAAKKERDPKNAKKAMEKFELTVKKFSQKIHKLSETVGQRCSSNEPDCPKNECCMKPEGAEHGTCRRFPGHNKPCSDMCGCNHASIPGSDEPENEMECRNVRVVGVIGVNKYKSACRYKTEPVSADVLNLRKMRRAKMSGKTGTKKVSNGGVGVRKQMGVPVMEMKMKMKQQSQTTSV